MNSLVEVLVAGATRDVARGVTVVDGRGAESFRSWTALVEDAQRRATWLITAHGLARHDRVLLAMPSSHAFVSSFLAVLMTGAVPVPVPRPSGLRARADAARLASIASSSRARLVLVDDALDTSLLALDDVRVASIADAAPAVRAWTPQPGDVAFVQYTSGSTSAPRGVVIDNSAAVAQLAALTAALDVRPTDVGVCWLPLFHDMGLVGGMLMTMAASMPLVLLSPSTFLHRPARWLRAVHAHRGTITAAPSSAYALTAVRARDDELAGVDLSSWRVALNGAEPIRADAVAAFCGRFAAHGFAPGAMVPAYGLAEATLAVATGPLGAGTRFTEHGCVIGAPVPGAEVSIAADGEIVVAAPFVARGYLDDPSASANVFGAMHVGADGAVRRERALRTGDLGALVGGELVVTGRKKDLICVRGKKINAEDVERIVESVPGARPHSAIAFAAPASAQEGEGIVVVMARARDEAHRSDDGAARFAHSVRDAIGEALGVSVLDVHVVSAADVPRTTSGKKQRNAAREMWLARAA